MCPVCVGQERGDEEMGAESKAEKRKKKSLKEWLNEPLGGKEKAEVVRDKGVDSSRVGRFRYWSADGRCCRARYLVLLLVWIPCFLFVAFVWSLGEVLGELRGSFPPAHLSTTDLLPVLALAGAAIALLLVVGLPFCFASVKRFHDFKRSGWYLLLTLIPFGNLVVVLALILVGGSEGPNKYGLPDDFHLFGPKASGGKVTSEQERVAPAEVLLSPPRGPAPAQKFCTNCGASLPAQTNFCGKCGSQQ